MFIRTLKKGGEILRLSAMPVKHIGCLYFIFLILSKMILQLTSIYT